MKDLLHRVTSAALALMFVAGISLALTGCSADTLSGPDLTSYTQDATSGSDAGHNTGEKTQDATSGSDAGHNTGE